MTITIFDVAEAAEVSIKTVSRVLNNEPNVREALRARVNAAIQRLGYRPNMAARSLRGRKSQVIVGLADASLTLRHLDRSRASHYFDRFLLGAMMRCRKNGYHLLPELIESGEPATPMQLDQLLTSLRPDGVILTPPSADDLWILDALDRAEVAYVRIGPTKLVERGARVYMDDRRAATEITQYLIDLGHTDIACILGNMRYSAAQLRLDGFTAAMGAAGLKIAPNRLVSGDFTFEGGLAAGQAIFAEATPPSAVFVSNDEMALGLIHAAAQRGLSVPGDMSVVGFDDFSDARVSIPPLTTIRQPVADMAYAAADMLIQGLAAAGRSACLPHELVVRASAKPLARAPAKTRAPRRQSVG